MVSYDANGNYGHPDHINAHRIAVGAWDAAAEADRYPEAGPPHAVAKLYEIAWNRDRWSSLMEDMKARDIALPWAGDEEEAEAAAETETDQEWGVAPEDLTTELDVSAWADRKRACMDCHKTQRQDMGWLLDLPSDLQARALSPESFVLRKWRDREVPDGYRETSVFD
jgi:LmbE family N-acetylglucosaminyl deacetylase